MSEYDWLCTMRDGGAVQRNHTTRMLRPQCLAAHSWGVVLVLLAVGMDRGHVLAYASVHDMAELATGDVPAPAKWDHPELEQALRSVEARFNNTHCISQMKELLSAEELALVKWADMYELVQTCIDERRLGNTFVTPMLRRALAAVSALNLRVHVPEPDVHPDVITSVDTLTLTIIKHAQAHL